MMVMLVMVEIGYIAMALKPRLGRDTEEEEINSGCQTRLFGCPPGRYLSGLGGFLLFPCLLCDAGERAPVEPSKLTPFFESLLWGPDSGLDLWYRNPAHTHIQKMLSPPFPSIHPCTTIAVVSMALVNTVVQKPPGKMNHIRASYYRVYILCTQSHLLSHTR